jgi:hypothetical protein
MNDRGTSLVELLIAIGLGLFVLQAAFLLQTGTLKMFKDVRTSSENVQTKVPSVELVARYFDRWGVNIVGNGTATGADCSAYPPSDSKCITVTDGSPCDEVIFWGNLYGYGFVSAVASGTATLASCRLSTSTGDNYYLMWSSDTLYNDVVKDGFGKITQIIPLQVGSLSANNADCSSLTSGSPTNATASATMTPTDVSYTSKTLTAGDFIQRAPHRVRLYCAQNGSDNNRNWLYARLTDTATGTDESADPVAPVDSFQVELLPTGCTPTDGGCRAAKMNVTFRSQATTYARTYKTHSVERTFWR